MQPKYVTILSNIENGNLDIESYDTDIRDLSANDFSKLMCRTNYAEELCKYIIEHHPSIIRKLNVNDITPILLHSPISKTLLDYLKEHRLQLLVDSLCSFGLKSYEIAKAIPATILATLLDNENIRCSQRQILLTYILYSGTQDQKAIVTRNRIQSAMQKQISEVGMTFAEEGYDIVSSQEAFCTFILRLLRSTDYASLVQPHHIRGIFTKIDERNEMGNNLKISRSAVMSAILAAQCKDPLMRLVGQQKDPFAQRFMFTQEQILDALDAASPISTHNIIARIVLLERRHNIAIYGQTIRSIQQNVWSKILTDGNQLNSAIHAMMLYGHANLITEEHIIRDLDSNTIVPTANVPVNGLKIINMIGMLIYGVHCHLITQARLETMLDDNTWETRALLMELIFYKGTPEQIQYISCKHIHDILPKSSLASASACYPCISALLSYGTEEQKAYCRYFIKESENRKLQCIALLAEPHIVDVSITTIQEPAINRVIDLLFNQPPIFSKLAMEYRIMRLLHFDNANNTIATSFKYATIDKLSQDAIVRLSEKCLLAILSDTKRPPKFSVRKIAKKIFVSATSEQLQRYIALMNDASIPQYIRHDLFAAMIQQREVLQDRLPDSINNILAGQSINHNQPNNNANQGIGM